jgi:hypothetical protein
VEAGSYDNIALSLGTDSPADILFATDNEHEAAVAIAAGWQVSVADLQQAHSCGCRTWMAQESVATEQPHPADARAWCPDSMVVRHACTGGTDGAARQQAAASGGAADAADHLLDGGAARAMRPYFACTCC